MSHYIFIPQIFIPKGTIVVSTPSVLSLVAVLVDTPDAKKIMKELQAKAEFRLNSRAMTYQAAEHPDRWYWKTVTILTQRFLIPSQIDFWDLGREIRRNNPKFNQDGYQAACRHFLQHQ